MTHDREMSYPSLFSRGFWIRREACKMAAVAVQGSLNGDVNIANLLWSMSAFFEAYMCEGCAGTREGFGPKEPVTLADVKAGRSE